MDSTRGICLVAGSRAAMENTSWFTRIGVIAILVLVVWNLYKGATVRAGDRHSGIHFQVWQPSSSEASNILQKRSSFDYQVRTMKGV